MPINDLSVFLIKVWNSGTLDVKVWNSKDIEDQKEKFEEAISFQFEGRKVVDWGVVETNPSAGVIEQNDLQNYLPPNPRPETNSELVDLPRCLLRPHQSFTVRILLAGPKGKVLRKGKLVDGEVRESDPNKEPIKSRQFLRVLLPITGVQVGGTVLLVTFFLAGLPRIFLIILSGSLSLLGLLALVLFFRFISKGMKQRLK